MTTPAGWYDDGSGNRRWWDGLQWTEHVVTDVKSAASESAAAESTVSEQTSAHETPVDAAIPVVPVAPEAPGSQAAAAEAAPFVPPYTLAAQVPSAPSHVSATDGSMYPSHAGSVAAAWPVAAPTPPPTGVPVVGIIGLVAVVVGVVCASIPLTAIVGWGLLAIGFVLSLVSLFLRGRKWPGITGLAVAVIGAVLAVAISFIVMATTSLSENDRGPLAVPSERPPGDDGSTTQGDDPSAIEGAEMTPFEELEVGDCIPLVEYGDEDMIFELPVVPCEQPHTDEVYLIFDVEDGEFPGDDALGVVASDGCLEAFEAYVGVPYEVSELDYYYYQPTKSSWARASDRTVQCILFSYEDVTGTLKGANR